MPIRQTNVKIPQVDREAILDKEFEELTPAEKRWLQDTDYWPTGQEADRQPVTFHLPDGTEVSNDPVWQMMKGQEVDLATNPMLRKLVEEKARELMEQRMAEVTTKHPLVAGETTQGQLPGFLPQGPSFDDLGGKKSNTIPEDVNPEDDEDDDVVPYELMGIQELRNEAITREPKISIAGDAGKKANLIPALEAWDAEHGGRPKAED